MFLLGGMTVGGLLIVGWLFYFRPLAEAVGTTTGQVVPRLVQTGQPSESAAAAAAPAPTPPPLTGNTPINILLLGSDTDAKFQGDYNTQIMIVVSINPSTKSVAMLSIPRDLWVPIPGHGTGKIGVAYGAGGVALARQAIESNFGITIHYYAWVGLDGFMKVIDTFGGVDADVSHPIVDDSYPDDVNTADPYAFRRLYIPAGWQHLDGTRALEYVRSRHGDLIGDFGRSQRQQQILDALRSKSGGREVVADLPRLADALKDSLRTDMTLPDIAKFAAFAEQIKGRPVQQYTLLPPRYSESRTAGDGESIVVPIWPEIRPLIDSIFNVKTTGRLPMGVPVIIGPKPLASATPTGSVTPTLSGSVTPAAKTRATPVARPTSAASARASVPRVSALPHAVTRQPTVSTTTRTTTGGTSQLGIQPPVLGRSP